MTNSSPSRPAVTPEALLADIEGAERVVRWMDRVKYVAGLLPALAAVAYYVYFRMQAPEYLPDTSARWMLGVGLFTSIVCIAGFTFLSRHFRKVLAEARETLYRSIPSLRPSENKENNGASPDRQA